MLVIGLGGGIASGKTSVSQRLAQNHNITVIDADVLAREALAPGTSGYRAVVAHFTGLVPGLVQADGALDRAALGRCIFNDENERRVLNSIVHPRVKVGLLWGVFKAWVCLESVVVVDVPLLFEGGLYKFCGLCIAVVCSRETQLERLLARDGHLSVEDAESRIASQMAVEDKRALADVVIENDGTVKERDAQVDAVVRAARPGPVRTFLLWILPVGLCVGMYRLFERFLRRTRHNQYSTTNTQHR